MENSKLLGNTIAMIYNVSKAKFIIANSNAR